MITALYIHIPFCERKCGYCDFTSVAGVRGQREYIGALTAELRRLGKGFPGIELDTIFFGGGTPGLLDLSLMADLMSEVRCQFAVRNGAEVTLEANPSSTSIRRATAWLEAGFNRVSIGIQSLEPDVLSFLGRVHDADRALAAVADVRAAGFRSVSCDLIYAVPGLDDDRWRRTVGRVVEAGPDHISCYELTVEAGTPLAAMVARGETAPPPSRTALRQHWLAVEQLGTAGYAQYEVSNFARPGQQCRHNLVYWNNGYYLAAGVGAHGHIPVRLAGGHDLAVGTSIGTGATRARADAEVDAVAEVHAEADDRAVAMRYWNVKTLAGYAAEVAAGRWPLAGSEAVDEEQHEAERLMLGLRLNAGVALGEVGGRELQSLVGGDLLVVREGRAHTTRRGQEVLNEVALRLVEAGQTGSRVR